MSYFNRIFLLLLFVNFQPIVAISQVYEHFNQDILHLKNAWNFSDSSFWVNPKNQLQSRVTTKKFTDVYASLPVQKMDSIVEWDAFISFDFNPSAQNNLRFYLHADSINLNNSTNALYVQFGGINGTDDLIELVKQQGNSKQVLAASIPGFLKQSTAAFHFKCMLDSIGMMQMQIDTALKDSFILLTSIKCPDIPLRFFTGFWFKFTSSHVNSLVLDDFYFGKANPILKPLRLINFSSISDSVLRFCFNQAIDTSQLPSHFQVSIPEVFTCIIQPSLDSLSLVFKSNINQYNTTQICLKNMVSKEGSTCPDTCLFQLNYQIKGKDIRITEIMADPEPVLGLPNVEYVELYNNCSYTISLENFSISDQSSTSYFTTYALKPAEFVLVCACSDSSLFPSVPKICVNTLPSLNNTSDTILILDTKQIVVDQVAYQSSWYHVLPIPNGGRSLCLTNVNSDCNAIENWHVSKDSIGGSPGAKGLLWNTNQNNTRLQLLSFTAINEQTFRAVFNQALLDIHVAVNGIELPYNKISFTADSFEFKMPMMNFNQKFLLHFYATCACNKNCLDTIFEYTFIPIQAAGYNQLLFSEILFEPVSGSGVPAFFELYNASKWRINLSDYKICNGNTCVNFPDYELYPSSYVAISKTGIPNSNNQIILPKLFQMNLTDTLCIRNSLNYLVTFFPYSQNYYHDLYKQTVKGWSVECVNMSLPCMRAFNWQACSDTKQHTAGLPNSNQLFTQDIVAAKLLKLYLPNEQQIQLDFNEAIDSIALSEKYILQVNGHQLNWHYTNSNQSLLAQISPPLIPNETYTLQLQQLNDCAGNAMPIQFHQFALPAPIDSGNLLINEVLFDPVSTGDDFIELYNNSTNYIDLKSLYFSFSENEYATLNAICTFVQTGYLLAPHDFVVVTKSDQSILFPHTNLSKQIFVNLPNLSNEGGFLRLHSADQKQLDAVAYSPQMHFKLLPSFEGVSLERISSNLPGTFQDNWHSASAQFNFATPTQINSMQSKIVHTENSLQIEPSVFSPDGDAFEDILKIQYHFNSLTNFSALTIYDLHGILIKNLAYQYWGADQGFWIWDGLNNSGIPVPEGFYVVKLDVFTPEGKLESLRKSIVLTRRERN